MGFVQNVKTNFEFLVSENRQKFLTRINTNLQICG